MENLIKDIGRSYIVSSLLPAIFFVLLLYILFRNIHPLPFFAEQSNAFDPEKLPFLQRDWVLPLAFTFWLAFGLYSSVDSVVKLFEGYWIKGKLADRLVKRQKAKYDKTLVKYKEYRNYLDEQGYLEWLEKEKGTKEAKKTQDRLFYWVGKGSRNINLLHTAALTEIAEAEPKFPLDRENLLPTRLGNILRASEQYGLERYRIESLSAWNRLFKVLPANALGELEEKHNHLLFLLNSALLAFVIAVIEFIATILFLIILRAEPYFPLLCFGLSVFFLIACYLLYLISLPAAEELGIITRSCIDLYRFDLMKKLHLPLPKTLEEERTRWQLVSEFMLAGFRLKLDKSDFSYVFSEEEQTITEKEPTSYSRRRRKSYRKKRGAKG